MQYLILQDYSSKISSAVQEKLNEGWVLYGNPFELSGLVCQAVIKSDLNDLARFGIGVTDACYTGDRGQGTVTDLPTFV